MPKPLVLALCAMSLAACGYPASNSVGVFVGTFPPGASCAVVDGARVVGQVDPTPGIVPRSQPRKRLFGLVQAQRL